MERIVSVVGGRFRDLQRTLGFQTIGNVISNLYGTVSSTLKNLGLPDNARSTCTVNRTKNEHIVWDIAKVMILIKFH